MQGFIHWLFEASANSTPHWSLIQVHIITALTALVIAPVAMIVRKGGDAHRTHVGQSLLLGDDGRQRDGARAALLALEYLPLWRDYSGGLQRHHRLSRALPPSAAPPQPRRTGQPQLLRLVGGVDCAGHGRGAGDNRREWAGGQRAGRRHRQSAAHAVARRQHALCAYPAAP